MSSTVIQLQIEERHLERFLNWRYRVMRGTFGTSIAAIGCSGVMYKEQMGPLAAVPLAFGALIAFASIGFDARNQGLLCDCYRRGATLMAEIGSKDGGPFGCTPVSANARWMRKVFTYHSLLRLLYTIAGAGLTYMAFWAALHTPSA